MQFEYWYRYAYVSKQHRKSEQDHAEAKRVYAVKNGGENEYNHSKAKAEYGAIWQDAGPQISSWIGNAVLVTVPPSQAGDGHLLTSGPYHWTVDLARRTGRPRLDAVARVHDVPKSSGGSDRPTVAQHLASLRPIRDVRGLDVVLVDDVVTRGSIMVACAHVLLGLGASSVRGLAAGHTVLGDGSRAHSRSRKLGWENGRDYPHEIRPSLFDFT